MPERTPGRPEHAVEDTGPTRTFGRSRSPKPGAAGESYDPTVTLSGGELQATIAGAVIQALALKDEREAAGKAAQRLDVELAFEARIKRLKLLVGILGGLVAVGGSVFTVFQWYADREVEAVVESRRRADVDEAIKAATTKHEIDQVSNETAHRDQSEALKAVGVLQLEQGADVRRILIESAPASKREALEEKPPALEAAEAKVRRQ